MPRAGMLSGRSFETRMRMFSRGLMLALVDAQPSCSLYRKRALHKGPGGIASQKKLKLVPLREPDVPDGQLIAWVLRFCCLATRFFDQISPRAEWRGSMNPDVRPAVHATFPVFPTSLIGFEIQGRGLDKGAEVSKLRKLVRRAGNLTPEGR